MYDENCFYRYLAACIQPKWPNQVGKGQKISKANFKVFMNENIFVFLPQPLKVVESRKYDKQHQISLFLLLFFVSTTFQGFFEARAEIHKYFCSFFGSNEHFKICFPDLLTFKGGFFSESAMKFFQISKSQKKNIPINYPELEI